MSQRLDLGGVVIERIEQNARGSDGACCGVCIRRFEPGEKWIKIRGHFEADLCRYCIGKINRVAQKPDFPRTP